MGVRNLRGAAAAARERHRVRALFSNVHGDQAAEPDRASRPRPRPATPAAPTTPAPASTPAAGGVPSFLPLAEGLLLGTERLLATFPLATTFETPECHARSYDLIGQFGLNAASALEFVASDSAQEIILPDNVRKHLLAVAEYLDREAGRFDDQEGDGAAWKERTGVVAASFTAIAGFCAQVRPGIVAAIPAGAADPALRRAVGMLIIAQAMLEGFEVQGTGDPAYWARTQEWQTAAIRRAVTVLAEAKTLATTLPANARQGLDRIESSLNALAAQPIAPAPTAKDGQKKATAVAKQMEQAAEQIAGALELLQEQIFPE